MEQEIFMLYGLDFSSAVYFMKGKSGMSYLSDPEFKELNTKIRLAKDSANNGDFEELETLVQDMIELNKTVEIQGLGEYQKYLMISCLTNMALQFPIDDLVGRAYANKVNILKVGPLLQLAAKHGIKAEEIFDPLIEEKKRLDKECIQAERDLASQSHHYYRW